MERSTNALAELAERFANGTITVKDIDAAGRIVAELAKLQFDANGKPNVYDAFHCAVNCRTIAEEGAGDDK